jgi:hypothetical protein
MKVIYENKVYIFHILNYKRVSSATSEIQILLNTVTTTLVKDEAGWRLKNAATVCPPILAGFIGRVIAARYRV